MMSQEYSKGTLINMLTKGLARRSVILSKLTVALVMWTAAYVICTGISYNPNVGGSSKGHLVRELDALGGEMGNTVYTHCKNYSLQTNFGASQRSFTSRMPCTNHTPVSYTHLPLQVFYFTTS